MTALQVRGATEDRQAIRTPLGGRIRSRGTPALGGLAALGALALLAWACAAPISTMRSPFHLRVVELRNTTDGTWVLEVAPVAGQDLLGGATTFTGELRPGEMKTLYLYHGFEYTFVVREKAVGHAEVARASAEVDRDIGFEFAGDSLVQNRGLVVRLGEPRTTFADSLMRETSELLPDTTRGRGVAGDRRLQREQERRDEENKRRRGEVP